VVRRVAALETIATATEAISGELQFNTARVHEKYMMGETKHA